MALPLLLIFHLGRIVPIAVGVGTALARFIAKNPKIIGSTLSIEAISSAILSHEATEKEKRRRHKYTKNNSRNSHKSEYEYSGYYYKKTKNN